MGLFHNARKADRELTQHMLNDIFVDVGNGCSDDFTTTVAGSLLVTANDEGLADDCGIADAYPPPGHGYPRP